MLFIEKAGWGINQMKSGVDYHFDADVLDRQLCILDSGETRVERRGSRQRAETSTRQTPLLIEVGFLTSWVDFHFLLIEVDFLTSWVDFTFTFFSSKLIFTLLFSFNVYDHNTSSFQIRTPL